MALYPKSPTVAHAQLPRPLPFSPSIKPCSLAFKRSQANNLWPNASTANDNEVSDDNFLSKDSDRTSWFRPNADSDPFKGWTSDDSQQNHSNKAGWLKVGGFGILAVGFALGAQAYLIQENKGSIAALPIIEQVLSSNKRCKSKQLQEIQSTNKMNENKDLQTDDANPDIPPREGLPAKPEGKVLIPAPVDHMQEQFMAALQALKIIEASAKAGDICRRRDYARWLIAASARLSRSPACTVFPAMYIEGVTKTAYADVLPEDKDFPYIQGLAEAGLISSRLVNDAINGRENDAFHFKPDSPLTRQDLVTWKIAAERNLPLPLADTFLSARKELQELSGFVDIDNIRQDACPALIADTRAGEKGITALAFGYTRRFQPEKPVTKVQAAVALATGKAWELVSKEVARLEAKSIAEGAVAAELALETKAQQEVAAAYNELSEAEKAKHQEAAGLIRKLEAQLEEVKAQYEEEKYALLKDRAEIDCERKLFSNMKQELEQQAQEVSSAKLDMSFQKEQVDKLRIETETERDKIRKIRAELETERNALTLARVWAEEEARRASAHSSLLQEARKRWEHGGVQVRVAKELDDVNIPGPNWHYSDGFQTQSSPAQRLLERGSHFIQQMKNALLRFLQLVVLFWQHIKHRSAVFAQGCTERIHEAKANCSDWSANTLAGIKNKLPSVNRLTTVTKERTSEAFAQCKDGAERLVEKLKVF